MFHLKPTCKVCFLDNFVQTRPDYPSFHEEDLVYYCNISCFKDISLAYVISGSVTVLIRPNLVGKTIETFLVRFFVISCGAQLLVCLICYAMLVFHQGYRL